LFPQKPEQAAFGRPRRAMALVPKKKPPTKAEREAAMREDLKVVCLAGNAEGTLAVLDASSALLNQPLDKDGFTALHLAALAGRTEVAEALIAAKADLGIVDALGRSALHISCSEGRSDIVQLLLASGIDANVVDQEKQTALHKAAYYSNVEVVRSLFQHEGISTGLKDDRSQSTAFSIAVELGQVEVVEYMLSQDAALAVTENDCGWTPLHLAAHGREMKSSTSMKPAKFSSIVRMLLAANAPVDAFDEDRKTALHRAATAGNTETVLVLIAANADLDAQDSCRWTPLHYACQEAHMPVLKQLLTAKAKVQEENAGCLVPLAIATLESHLKVAELLMQHGADPNLRGRGVASPATIARQDPTKHKELLSLFELGYISH